MRNESSNHSYHHVTLVRALLPVGIGLLIAVGVAMQSATVAQSANTDRRAESRQLPKAFSPPLQRATDTAHPTGTLTPSNPGPTPTPTSDGTADPSLPDLTVVAMQITLERGNACATSTQLGLRVYIRNDGGATTKTFSLAANGATMEVEGGLEAGASSSVWFPSYRYPDANTASVDSTDQIAESDETNNTLTQMVPIPTLPILCTATPTVDLTASPTTTPTATMQPEPTTSTPSVRHYLPLVGNTHEGSPTPER